MELNIIKKFQVLFLIFLFCSLIPCLSQPTLYADFKRNSDDPEYNVRKPVYNSNGEFTGKYRSQAQDDAQEREMNQQHEDMKNRAERDELAKKGIFGSRQFIDETGEEIQRQNEEKEQRRANELRIKAQQAQQARKTRESISGQREFFEGTEKQLLKKRKENERKEREEKEIERSDESRRKKEGEIAQERAKYWRLIREKELAQTPAVSQTTLVQISKTEIIPTTLPSKLKETYSLPDKIYLKNGEVMDCLIINKDAKGVWVDIDKGARVRFENGEIKKLTSETKKEAPSGKD